ncbi:MAG: LysM peptidoglycan-binding domain-containing protein [Alicyclobacillus sp.]|nr:LysM peptidoglycan-binding domain-containing protein [Alicyclobacillus sp.]
MRLLRKTLLAGFASCSLLLASGAGVADAALYATYTVQDGDTFYKIAHRYGVSLGALEAANPQVRMFVSSRMTGRHRCGTHRCCWVLASAWCSRNTGLVSISNRRYGNGSAAPSSARLA